MCLSLSLQGRDEFFATNYNRCPHKVPIHMHVQVCMQELIANEALHRATIAAASNSLRQMVDAEHVCWVDCPIVLPEIVKMTQAP